MDYEALMDDRQKHLHEHFPSTSKLSDPEFVKKLLEWLTFWRRNPNRFRSEEHTSELQSQR